LARPVSPDPADRAEHLVNQAAPASEDRQDDPDPLDRLENVARRVELDHPALQAPLANAAVPASQVPEARLDHEALMALLDDLEKPDHKGPPDHSVQWDPRAPQENRDLADRLGHQV